MYMTRDGGWGSETTGEMKYKTYVGEWGWGVEGSRLEAWIKRHKSEVAIT